MKNSGIEWIGEIPDGWEVNLVKNIFDITRGRVIAKTEIEEEFMEGYYPVYSSQTANSGILGYIPSYDFAIDSLTWTTDGAKAGTVFLRKGKYSITNVCGILTLKTSEYSLNYLYYAVGFSAYNSRRADINGYKIMSNEMAAISIPVPDKIEQQKIADILDEKCGKIDKLIENEQKQIEKMKEYKQSVITSAVTKGLDPNAPMKDSGIDWIGEIPESWSLKKLKQICSEPLQYGANANGVLFDDTLPRYVRITDILDNTLRQDIQKQSLPLEIAKDYFLRDGDILFARSGGTVGKSFIFREHYGTCAFAGYLIRARISKEYISQYIYYYTLSSCYNEWKNAIFIQSTIQNIGASKYANLDIPMPNYKEQKQIVDYLDEKCGKIDEVISIKQSKIEKLQEYKKSLIYEYVTGKKEVV